MTACPRCKFDPEARVLASWSFHVPREIRSGNARINNVGGSRWAYKAAREAWANDIGWCAKVHGITKATGKRRVTLTRIIGYRQRAFDRDNLAAGFKPVVDAIVRCGLLIDDNPKHAEVHFQQEKRHGVSGVYVLIEEVAP